jgi:16S rRNA A1518/A1519 N6-dimethyltransferase RsmA/KsgA/DIM1 with predicted DNA glycosylase/AP lyase activity
LAFFVGQTRTPDIFFSPTRHNIADAMLLLARIQKTDVVYDRGSGDGRIPIIAAQKYGAKGVGIEIEQRLVDLSWQNANEGLVADKVKFIVGDFFKADISEATIVTLYLSASINCDLEAKLRTELKPGTRIVSHDFPIGKWTPDEILKVDEATLFLWTVPAR